MGIAVEADLSLGVALGAKLDGIHELLKKDDPKPVYLDVAASINGAPGTDVLGRPPAGKIWNILFVSTTGADDHTSLPNVSVAIYVDSDDVGLSLGLCRIPGLVVPQFLAISKGTLWAHSTGSILANFSGSGLTAGVNVTCTMTVAEWDVHDQVKRYTR